MYVPRVIADLSMIQLARTAAADIYPLQPHPLAPSPDAPTLPETGRAATRNRL